MKKNYNIYLVIGLLTLFSCEQDIIENPVPPIVPEEEAVITTEGTADFSNFVALGNSLTAGFQANALFTEGQNNSLPLIIYSKMGREESFVQPEINSENGYSGMVGSTVFGRFLLQGTPPGPSPTISNAEAIPSPLNPAFEYTGSTSELNNFGVPGILLGQALIPQTGDWSLLGADPRVNPFYARFASNPGISTLLDDMMSANPTFFLFWLGNNDVLGYATGGATGSVPLTPQIDFETQYGIILSTLTTNPDVKGVVGNIPDVTSIPFFTAVPWNSITFNTTDPEDAGTVSLLNTNFAGFNAALDGIVSNLGHSAADADQRKINYADGSNPTLIYDKNLENLGPKFDILQGAGAITAEQRAALEPYVQARPIKSTELLTLTSGAVLGTLANPSDSTTVIGVAVPLEDQYALTTAELTEINDAIVEFNNTIATEVAKYSDQVALADVNQTLADLSNNGFAFANGVTLTPDFTPPTGAFSEDGVHPNSRGYAFAANTFIEAINTKFGSDIPLVNIGNYQGVALPINP
ncbi:MAG: hypothetical protein AAGF85_09310 [Bacteroidota bacterium]